jgi:hypothetical protein
MEREQLEQQIQDSKLRTWEKLMYVSLGSAVTIIFHGIGPLRDAIILFTLLYTTFAGFYLLWTSSERSSPLAGWRKQITFGHLCASWLVVPGIYSYSMLPPLGFVFLAYTVFILAIYWRTRKNRALADEMFP